VGGSIETTLVSLERQAACLRKLERHTDAATLLREARGLFALAPGFTGRCEVLVMLGDSLEVSTHLLTARATHSHTSTPTHSSPATDCSGVTIPASPHHSSNPHPHQPTNPPHPTPTPTSPHSILCTNPLVQRSGDIAAAAAEGWVPLERTQDCIACGRLALWDAAPSRLARLAHVRGDVVTAAAHWLAAATLFGGCTSTALREARAEALCFAGLSATERGVLDHDPSALREGANHFAAALEEMASLSVSDDAATELLQLASAGATATAAQCAGSSWPINERDTAALDASVATLHGAWLLRCSKDEVAADARFSYARDTATKGRGGNAADPLSMAAASATRLLQRDATDQQ
jgi:hypothetical protein